MSSNRRTAPLHIFVDGAIIKPGLGGISTYVSGVVAGLSALADVEVSVATSMPKAFDRANVRVIHLPTRVQDFGPRLLWRETRLPRLIASSGANILFAPTIEVPLRSLRVPSIMVVHDVGPLKLPAYYGWPLWLRYAIGIPVAVRRADRVVCVSESTRHELELSLGRRLEKALVIGEAGRELPAPMKEAELPSHPPYVLTVSAMLRHKNIETLVQAMDSDDLEHVHLVVAGPANAAERAQFETWRQALGQPSRVLHVGFVDLQMLANLYAGASAVALPSLYEGFGLPLVEAMRSGAPVVASAIAPFQEIAGDAAAYVSSPLDPKAWASVLRTIISDDERAADLRMRGARRVATLEWTEIASNISIVARDLVG